MKPNGMTDKAIRNREFVQNVRAQLLMGAITREEAKQRLAPLLAEMNTRAKEIAKEYGGRYKPISFTSLMR